MKRRIAVLGAVTVLLGCSSATVANELGSLAKIEYQSAQPVQNLQSVLGKPYYQTMLQDLAQDAFEERQRQLEIKEALIYNKLVIDNTIDKLHNYVGKTWYVFSGSTPRGWDCSGLVVWFYGEIGIEVPHSATKQGFMKPKVKNPKPGDIVVTKYINSKNFIHSGIYIGDNKMIHSGFKKGQRTEIIDLNDPSFDGQKHYFVRVIDTID